FCLGLGAAPGRRYGPDAARLQSGPEQLWMMSELELGHHPTLLTNAACSLGRGNSMTQELSEHMRRTINEIRAHGGTATPARGGCWKGADGRRLEYEPVPSTPPASLNP